jgi:hypothetical protein
MQQFINTFFEQVYNDLQARVGVKENRLCELIEQFPPNGYRIGFWPDYSTRENQANYLLRYFYAYLLEYRCIFEKLASEQSLTWLTEYRVLSLGCGAALDYYGLYFSGLNTDAIHYHGYDINDWGAFQESFGNRNVVFHNRTSITELTERDFEGINIIMFPKSISDFSDNDFYRLCELIQPVQFTFPLLVIYSHAMDRDNFNCRSFSKYTNFCKIIRGTEEYGEEIRMQRRILVDNNDMDRLFNNYSPPPGFAYTTRRLPYQLCREKPEKNQFCRNRQCYRGKNPPTTPSLAASNITVLG